MFSRHLITEINNEKILYLFIDYNYEFASLGYQNQKEKSRTLYKKVLDYIKDKKIDFNGTKIFLVVNGLIIGSIVFGYHPYSELKAEISPKYQYVEYIDTFNLPDLENDGNKVSDDKVLNNSTEKQIISKDISSGTIEKDIFLKSDKQTESTDYPHKPTEKSSPIEENPPEKKPEPIIEEVIDKVITVTLYRSNGTIAEIPLEDYIVGVVSAEMPASFHTEALKAQAVAARTYALKRMAENKILTDTSTHQMYKDNNQLQAYWGGNFNTYYNKIKNAVSATKNEYISHNNYYIDAVYHSTSNGKTENAIDVWGNSFSYLVSVDSPWDKAASSYLRETALTLSTVNNLLNLTLKEDSIIEITSRTQGDNINILKLDGHTFTGKYIRETLGLRSTDFDIRIEGNNVIFTTRGYGHGVGMSQYGANGMANQGNNYKQILTHYYKGASIKT